MDWYSGLYVGEKAKSKKDSLIQMAESGKTPFNTYLLALPFGEANQLEVLPAWDLKFWHEDDGRRLKIVGLACGKKEALSLVRQITEDVFTQTGGVRLRDFFLEKWNCEASETTAFERG